MIEKETDGSDRETIASVIYNRLNNPNASAGTNGYLQIDATLAYINGGNVPTDADRSIDSPYNTYLYPGLIDSPYNTYLYPGLPPGPIANPGMESIQAAMNPADTSYYYYALGDDNTHHFFRTYSEMQSFAILNSLEMGPGMFRGPFLGGISLNEKKIELLAPAGDMERLEMALAYGADAVYLAGTTFGMRSFAGNFSPEELKTAVELCHSRGVRVHVTCNTMPRNEEAPAGVAGVPGQPGGGRGDSGRHGGVLPGREVRPPCGAAHIHPGQRGQLPVCPGLVRPGGQAGHSGPGAVPGRDPGDPGQDPQGVGAGGLCPRGHVRELLRTVPAV